MVDVWERCNSQSSDFRMSVVPSRFHPRGLMFYTRCGAFSPSQLLQKPTIGLDWSLRPQIVPQYGPGPSWRLERNDCSPELYGPFRAGIAVVEAHPGMISSLKVIGKLEKDSAQQCGLHESAFGDHHRNEGQFGPVVRDVSLRRSDQRRAYLPRT